MKEKALHVLEYGKIIQRLVAQADSQMAKQVIGELRPSHEVSLIEEGLIETTEAVTLIRYKGPLPLGGFYDIGDTLQLAQKGGTLTMGQLLQVKYNLSAARRVSVFLKGDLPPLPVIQGIRQVLALHKPLEDEIDCCILSEEEMADGASPTLRQIRRAILRQNEALRAKLHQLVNGADNRSILQDAIITLRDGRYVLPVKQEHRTAVPGIVHGQSATGATLFIEPQSVVNMNNALRQLEAEEKTEIERILGQLSEAVAAQYHDLSNNQKLLTQLDVIMAKGKLSLLQKGEAPNMDTSGTLILKEARHPLLDPKQVVPINVSLGGGCQTLVITGPNTGGKTVSLKTIGLLCLMAQTGLHIPAAADSRLPVFRRIFADIGDEQSIEQSLSTFSSHMTNIVDIVDKSDGQSLVLLDELGAGTDPTEGAALAISILQELSGRGALTAATTHYTELKKYAIATDRVENASMEFDVDTLSPTYRLVVGLPGKSNAFEISQKLGLPQGLIEKAKSLLQSEDLRFEDVVSALEADKRAAEAERDEAMLLNIAMKKQKAELDKKAQHLAEQQEKLLNRAKAEAKTIIQEAKDLSEEVKEELRELSKLESLGQRNKGFDQSRKKLKAAEESYRETIIREVNDNPVSPEDLKPGDRVKVMTLGQTGEIISLPDEKGEVTVQMGMMKVKTPIADIMLIEGGIRNVNREKKSKNYSTMYRAKSQQVPISLNVRGQTLDEASIQVDKYLDEAFMGGLATVTIIHGRGEGILKTGLQQMMRSHKHVKDFRKGAFNEGGDGVTVVTLQ